MPGAVPWNQARQILRLTCEGHEIGRGTAEAWRHIVDGMCRVLGASHGAMVRLADLRPGGHGAIRLSVLSRAYEGDGGSARIVAALSSQVVTNPAAATLMRRVSPDGVATAGRRELVADPVWYRSTFMDEYVRPAHQDDCLLGASCDSAGGATGLAFTRPWGEPPFSDEDRDALHLFTTECARAFTPAAPAVKLPPRTQATLEMLLEGCADKEIAARLSISTHTVRDYVKAIFRSYGVSSRAQLLALHLR